MAKRKQENTCEICGRELSVLCSGYTHKSFIDGRHHAELCHICYEVPKMAEWDEKLQKVMYYSTMDPKRLCTIEELMSGGWEKKECETSLKAVKKAIANRKPEVVPEPSLPPKKKRIRPIKAKAKQDKHKVKKRK